MESDRLNQVENNLQTVTDILLAVARRAETTDARLDRLTETQERTQSQLDRFATATDARLDRLTETQDRMQSQLNQLREDIDIAVETIVALSSNTNATLASINAALERQDRVLDYLLRRDRDLDPPST